MNSRWREEVQEPLLQVLCEVRPIQILTDLLLLTFLHVPFPCVEIREQIRHVIRPLVALSHVGMCDVVIFERTAQTQCAEYGTAARARQAAACIEAAKGCEASRALYFDQFANDVLLKFKELLRGRRQSSKSLNLSCLFAGRVVCLLSLREGFHGAEESIQTTCRHRATNVGGHGPCAAIKTRYLSHSLEPFQIVVLFVRTLENLVREAFATQVVGAFEIVALERVQLLFQAR